MSSAAQQQRIYCCNLCGKCPIVGAVYHCQTCRDWGEPVPSVPHPAPSQLCSLQPGCLTGALLSFSDCCEECRSDPDTQSEMGYTEMHDDSHELESTVSTADPREPIVRPSLLAFSVISGGSCTVC